MNTRPQTLQDLGTGVDSLDDFGRNFRDWLHTLRGFSSRIQVARAIHGEPPRLAERFSEGLVADAWLAAYAELLAGKTGQPVPEWAFGAGRVARSPWFADDTPGLRALALIQSPLPFKRRNLFTPSVELPLRLRAGRPGKSLDEKRRTNADRQRRFRKRRRRELAELRSLKRMFQAQGISRAKAPSSQGKRATANSPRLFYRSQKCKTRFCRRQNETVLALITNML